MDEDLNRLAEDDSESDSDDSALEENGSGSTYDVTLATKHSYLGGDFEELRGRTLFDEGAVLWIPLLLEATIVLVPGQVLPLTVFYPRAVEMLKDLIKKDRTLGVCYLNEFESVQSLGLYGTTAEIFQWHEEYQIPGIKIKAQGRQRFKLLDQQRIGRGVIMGKVKILPEIRLDDPLSAGRLPSLDKYRTNKTFRTKNSLIDTMNMVWPRWVYNFYTAEEFVELIKSELGVLKYVPASIKLPESLEAFSFWILQGLPIDNSMRMNLLSLNTPVERLQHAYRLLQEKSKRIFCDKCLAPLALRKHMIVMSSEGPQGTFCNPQGYIHEMLTVSHVQGIATDNTDPSLEYTWFPGYGWTIAYCWQCRNHVGWLFTAMHSKMKPQQFWGLSKRNVTCEKSKRTWNESY